MIFQNPLFNLFANSFSYGAIFLYLFICFIVTVILFLVSLWFSPNPPISNEKLSSYECGFEPYGDARAAFDVHFYIIGILFLVFDLEVVFLYPWVFSSVTLSANFIQNLTTIFIFIWLLLLGFFYEWMQQALTWVSLRFSKDEKKQINKKAN